ncbi:MAG: SpoIVB peptidase S55 domain-containing protein [Acidobacteriota bacterium]|nr:SpoIVB peptidase S55 domain-containing protein [Acidobacteriota bacterium]
MLRRVISSFVLCLTCLSAFAAEKANVQIMPEDQVKAGMHGVAYTVFEGVKPEAMDVEILGVLRNMAGPKSDVILGRLHGQKVEYTGVVAGMSGSPVYIDGKLVGAIAYRIGEFSKEPIAGITPAATMLEINDMDKAPSTDMATTLNGERREASRTSGPGPSSGDSAASYSNLLKPIETPLVFTGFSEQTLSLFSNQFASSGIVPVMGAGSVSNDKQPEPLEPGSAVSAILVRGDMNIAGTCTVTYLDDSRLLACGHPLLQSGNVDMPMTKATVLATLPSPANSFKIVNTTEAVGTFVQDRRAGIMGRFDREPHMIPVTLRFNGVSRPKQFHYEVLNNAKITPAAMMATVFNAIQGMNEYGENTTYRLRGDIAVLGYPKLGVSNMYAPSDGAQPTAHGIAVSIGERFSRIFDNPYETPKIEGVELDFDLVPDRRSARLETARTDVTEARPGDQITIETLLRPYRGESILRQIPVKIPTSTPKGTLRILVSDGDTLDKMRRAPASLNRRLDLGSTIALLNKEHSNSQLYVSLLEANPQAMVEDKVMPTLPLSVMNVMDGMRGTQDMFVTGESALDEASTPMDYVVTGSQILTLTIK